MWPGGRDTGIGGFDWGFQVKFRQLQKLLMVSGVFYRKQKLVDVRENWSNTWYDLEKKMRKERKRKTFKYSKKAIWLLKTEYRVVLAY